LCFINTVTRKLSVSLSVFEPEATNLLNEAKRLDKQGMLKEQITMMNQMKDII
jgi:hypothetical protein